MRQHGLTLYSSCSGKSLAADPEVLILDDLPQRRVRQLACFVDTAEPAEEVLAVGGGERPGARDALALPAGQGQAVLPTGQVEVDELKARRIQRQLSQAQHPVDLPDNGAFQTP